MSDNLKSAFYFIRWFGHLRIIPWLIDTIIVKLFALCRVGQEEN